MARVISYTTGPGHLPYPEETSDADISRDLKELAQAADAGYSTFTRGPKSLRPVSSLAQHGIARRVYWAYDTGELWYDTGVSWELLDQARGTAGGDLTGTYPNPVVRHAAGDFDVGGDVTIDGNATVLGENVVIDSDSRLNPRYDTVDKRYCILGHGDGTPGQGFVTNLQQSTYVAAGPFAIVPIVCVDVYDHGYSEAQVAVRARVEANYNHIAVPFSLDVQLWEIPSVGISKNTAGTPYVNGSFGPIVGSGLHWTVAEMNNDTITKTDDFQNMLAPEEYLAVIVSLGGDPPVGSSIVVMTEILVMQP